jgi:hypothetical protein
MSLFYQRTQKKIQTTNKTEEEKYLEINSHKTSENEDEMIDEQEYMLSYRKKIKKKLYVSPSDSD